MPSQWPPKPVTLPSHRTAPAKRKTPLSRISQWQPAPDRSRPARPAARTALRNTTSFCASKKNSARTRNTPAERLSTSNMPKPLVLTILDGWGFSPAIEGNAIAAARKPVYDALLRDYPNTLVQTSGPFVGLPDGQMGNSEVGHLNIGAGRVIHMDVTRIDLMIASGDFFKDPTLLAAMHHARGRRLHLMGLLSDGGVHAMNTHLYALIE